MTENRQKLSSCPNCGSALEHDDNFCHYCGQQNHDLRVPFRHLLLEALEGFVHFDIKSFRTIFMLLFKPGSLTNEFKAGKRMLYVPPIRLYIFLSFIFFLLLSLVSGKHTSLLETEAAGTTSEIKKAPNELNISFFNIDSHTLQGLSETQIDSLLQTRGIERSPFNKYMAKQVSRLNGEGRKEFIHRLLTGISYMMFVLMPIFALFLYLFYRKRVDYYIDCLVFSVHYHSFAFTLFTLYLLFGLLMDTGWLLLALPAIFGVYCYLGLRAVFQQSWWRTILKTISIGILHVVSIIVCIILTVIVSVVLF
jgi:hypothetical protein